ncbi:MAG: chemotaxis protein CheA [Cyclobacteriaceae bacterium]|nr:chemotaxis protein CheA [Cyclobacteriaceae bacterium]MCH8516739.1 chemotaxis protein CheA [Cyclobacteriaceae bacterium]
MAKEDEFKEIFLAEAQEQQDELEKLFTDLEKDHGDKQSIEAIFRITHTLKANAAGMGFEDIAGMAHVMEDIFSEIKQGNIKLNTRVFNDLFKANDTLSEMISVIKSNSNKKVRYRGLKTKLQVMLRDAGAHKDQEEGVKTANSISEKQKSESQEEVTPSSQENEKQLEEKKEKAEDALLDIEDENIDDQQEDVVVEASSQIQLSDNVSIPVRKLDHLMNLVGELLIERDRVVTTFSDENKKRRNEFTRLQRITSELQYSVMDVRLVQVAVLFNKFHRIVRDVATLEDKRVNLVLEGTENEIDRNILQIISDSLIHLVRNAVSHGLEASQERVKQNKKEEGTVTLRARSERDEIIIDVSDDGRGINPEIIRKKAVEKKVISAAEAKKLTDDDARLLIFEAGFSSAEKVTSVSGRGVGMDVVRKAIDSIGGNIEVSSEVGKGTTISMRLPSSMAVKSALLFQIGEANFAIPLSYTQAVEAVYKKDIHRVGNGLVIRHLKKNKQVAFLSDMFEAKHFEDLSNRKMMHKRFKDISEEDKIHLVIISNNGKEVALVVDVLKQQKEIVEKPLDPMLEGVKFISGATILGDGNVCLVLDVPEITQFLFKTSK